MLLVPSPCNCIHLIRIPKKYHWIQNCSKYGFIQKVRSKQFNFDKTLQFFSGNLSCQHLKSANLQHFHEFFTQIFFDIFLVKSKLPTAKKSKTAAFSRVVTHNNSTIFLRKSLLNFWTKNEDFEQCDIEV